MATAITTEARKIIKSELPNFQVFLTNDTEDARVDYAVVKADILAGVPTIQGQKGDKGDKGDAGSSSVGLQDAVEILFNPATDVLDAGAILTAFKNHLATPTLLAANVILNGRYVAYFKSIVANDINASLTTAINAAGIIRNVTAKGDPNATFVNHGSIRLFAITNNIVNSVEILKDDSTIFNRIDAVENKIPTVTNGAKGDKGDVGEMGPTGPKGDKGDPGSGSGTAVNKFDMQYAKKIPFVQAQQLQIADLETLFRRNVAATVLEGYYSAYFSNEGTNPLAAFPPFLNNSAVLNYSIGGQAETLTVSQGFIASFRYEADVLTDLEILDDARLYREVRNIVAPSVYEMARPLGNKNISGVIKASVLGASIVEVTNILGSKKGYIITLTDPAANIRWMELYFGALQTACDTDNNLYIALKVNVPTVAESEYGRKRYPKIPDFETTPSLAFPATVTNPRNSVDNGLAQRQLLVEPATVNDYILYCIVDVAQLGAGTVSFTSF
jgi:hypothetical protein